MKLAAALAVPLMALLSVTIFEVIQSARDVQRVREQTALAEASIGPVSLLSILEHERNAAGVYLLGADAAFDPHGIGTRYRNAARVTGAVVGVVDRDRRVEDARRIRGDGGDDVHVAELRHVDRAGLVLPTALHLLAAEQRRRRRAGRGADRDGVSGSGP